MMMYRGIMEQVVCLSIPWRIFIYIMCSSKLVPSSLTSHEHIRILCLWYLLAVHLKTQQRFKNLSPLLKLLLCQLELSGIR